MKQRGLSSCAPRAGFALVVCAVLTHAVGGCGGGEEGSPPGAVPGADGALPVTSDAGVAVAGDGGLRTPDGGIVAPDDWVPDDEPTPALGLVARFNFDGTYPRVPDLSASGNHAAFACVDPCKNGPPPLHPGWIGYGVELAWWQLGTVPPSPTLNASNDGFTLGLWLQRRIHYMDERNVLGRESEARDGKPVFALSLVDGQFAAQVGDTRVTDPNGNPLYGWVHVAVRFDGANVTLFRNGAPVAAAKVATVATAETTSLLLGSLAVKDTPTSYADCVFDEIRLYADPLTDDAIAALAR